MIGSTWKTVLLSAEGNGGDTVFCLDVTNPLSPTFLWEFADPDLFRSRSSPAVAVVGRVNPKTWAAFFVSGKTYDDTLYPSVYMINIDGGGVIQRIFLDSVSAGIGGVPSGQPAVVDSDGDGYVDRMYIGTDKGYLYKVNIPNDPSSLSNFTQCVINADISGLERHPIYASPVVVVQNTSDIDGKIINNIKILFGTGDSPYYDENINTDDTRYNFFAYEDTAEKGGLCGDNVKLDWLYELPKGQRIFASAFAAAGRIYFGTSTSETEDPCEGAGNPLSNAGKLHVMDIEQTGSPAPKFTIDTGDILTAPVVDDENLYVKTGKGFYLTPGPYNNPITGPPLPPSVVTWREIFGKDELSSTTTTP